MAMKPPRLIAVLPTMLTLGNAACGFGAITIAARVGPEGEAAGNLLSAGLLIYLAMLFDMLDGSAARLTKQTSELGAQLDSLCDAVSFGVAPAFLMLQFVHHVDTANKGFDWPSRLLWTMACLYAVCAIMRLARFNVETEEEDSHDEFSGLPSPAAAGAVASFPVSIQQLTQLAQGSGWKSSLANSVLPWVHILLPLVTLGVGCLMVSRFRYPHFFNQFFRRQRSGKQIVQLVLGLGAIYTVHELAVPMIFCWYAFTAPLKRAWVRALELWSPKSATRIAQAPVEGD